MQFQPENSERYAAAYRAEALRTSDRPAGYREQGYKPLHLLHPAFVDKLPELFLICLPYGQHDVSDLNITLVNYIDCLECHDKGIVDPDKPV
jgi:hypothetical protein